MAKTEFRIDKERLAHFKQKLTEMPRKVARETAQKALKPSSMRMKKDMKKALRVGIKTYGAKPHNRLRGQSSIANAVVLVTKNRPAKNYYMSGVGIKKTRVGIIATKKMGTVAQKWYAYMLRKGSKIRKTKTGKNRGRIQVKGDYVETLWNSRAATEQKNTYQILAKEIYKWDV